MTTVQKYNYNSKDIHSKINIKESAILYLSVKQYFQLIELNKLILAPYYNRLMQLQQKEVKDALNFKAVFGKFRYELENNI